MKKSPMAGEAGVINALLLPLLAAIVLLIGAVAFAAWSFSSRQDYKNNVDSKISVAVVAAQKAESTAKEKEFAQRSKNPFVSYTSPSEYGNIVVTYPRTWSGYVADTGGASPYIDGYFAPGVVPSKDDQGSIFALRIQLIDDSYSTVMQNYSSQDGDQPVTIQPYSVPKVPKVIGSRLDGAIFPNKQGSLVVLPVRDKTLEIWTESSDFTADFNDIILPNLSFSP